MVVRPDSKVALAIALASILAIVVAGIGVVSTWQFAQDAKWVAHSHTVRGEILAVSTHVEAAKADIRGFLLTRDSAYLRRHHANLDSSEVAFLRLEALVTDNPEQQERVVAVRDLLTRREIAFDQTLALQVPSHQYVATIGPRLTIGEALTARIDSTLAVADGDERALLAARSARQANSERFVAISSGLLVLVAGLLAFMLRRSIRHDLHLRARMEANLRASEAKFAGILAIGADAIITVDEQRTILHFNHGAIEVFGYEPAEVLGKSLEMLLPARHAGTHPAHIHAFAAGGDVARQMGERREIHGRRKNGEEFPAEASISKLMTPTGWIFTAVLRDVTDHMRRETHERALATAGVQLSHSLEYDETLITVASVPVPPVGEWSVLDLVGDLDQGDTEFRRIASAHTTPAAHAALREWESDVLDWDSPEAVIDVLRTGRLQRIDAVSDDWLEAHLAQPRQVAVAKRIGMHSLLIIPLASRGRVLGTWTIGSSPGHVFNDNDVELAVALAESAVQAIENARLMRRAQRARMAREQVLGVVSHDLRNPISAVAMLARRLVADPPVEDGGRAIGANILCSVDWMYRLVEDLLDAASIDAGKLKVEPAPYPLPAIVQPVLEMFGDRADAQHILLGTEDMTTAPLVLADATRIGQVIGNLVGNALKFTPSGGRVTIGARPDSSEMLLWIRDNGVGIPIDDIPHVFDRFWHARRNSNVRGTGLGLPISQGIVRAHGGRIWVESTLGLGSTFFFTLPLARALMPGTGLSTGTLNSTFH
ncbi:MAG: ATP-binding protein [Gemmatimonadaceae bacterium]